MNTKPIKHMVKYYTRIGNHYVKPGRILTMMVSMNFNPPVFPPQTISLDITYNKSKKLTTKLETDKFTNKRSCWDWDNIFVDIKNIIKDNPNVVISTCNEDISGVFKMCGIKFEYVDRNGKPLVNKE